MKLLDQLGDERAEITDAQTEIVNRAADESRDLTDSEDTNLRDLKTRADTLDVRITELRAVQVANLEAAKLRAEVAGTDDAPEERAVGRVTITDEPRTYREGGDHDFFVDAYRSTVHQDPAAQQRIQRHQAEMALENRDSTSADFAGLVPPAYLVNQALAKARASRPLADACNRQPLPPSGTDIVITRLTTGATTAAQSSQNAAVTESTPDDTTQTISLKTYAAQVDVSRQALDRGVGISNLLIEDLVASYSQALDSAIISGDGSSGAHTGILSYSGTSSVTYTAATATAAGLYEKILKAIDTVQTSVYRPATLLALHPRRWSWFVGKGLDSQNRPLVLPSMNAPTNAMGIGGVDVPQGVVGQIAGVPVLLDASIPTNLGAGTDEDRIICARMDDVVLWEQSGASPNVMSFDQIGAGSLTVKLVSWGYSAFGIKDPAAVAIVSGTGLNDTL